MKFTVHKNEEDAHPDMKPWLVTDEGGVIVSDHDKREDARAEAQRLNDYESGKKAALAEPLHFRDPENAQKNFYELALKFPEGSPAHKTWLHYADAAAVQFVKG